MQVGVLRRHRRNDLRASLAGEARDGRVVALFGTRLELLRSLIVLVVDEESVKPPFFRNPCEDTHVVRGALPRRVVAPLQARFLRPIDLKIAVSQTRLGGDLFQKIDLFDKLALRPLRIDEREVARLGLARNPGAVALDDERDAVEACLGELVGIGKHRLKRRLARIPAIKNNLLLWRDGIRGTHQKHNC